MQETNTEKNLVDLLGKKINRQLLYYLDTCARCSICKDACHQYVVTGDIKYIPAYRAELLRRIYKRYFTPAGKTIPFLYEAKEIDEKLLDELSRVTYACTGCRRCMVYCPFAIDTTWILSTAKALLNSAGKTPQILVELTNAAIEKGKSIDLFKEIILDTLKEMEKELKEKVNDANATIPVDKKEVEILYVALAGKHTILPAGIIFHQAKANWTLSLFEASNYAYFLGDPQRAKIIADRIIEEAKRLRVKEIVVSECGHAYRVFKHFYQLWSGEKLPFWVRSIVEVIYEYLKEGRIKISKEQINEPITYHDPCQLGRNGGIFEEPRYILRSLSSDFREINPNRERNWCCGGGGGLVANPDFEELRIKTGEIKAKQITESGAKTVVSACENCRLQISSLNEKYNLGIKVTSVSELVAENLS